MMRKVLAALAVAGLLASTGCSKIAEYGNDAPVKSRDDSPADVYSMPDGFSNVASKCDRYGNRMYVLYHGDSPYGSVAVVPADPSCRPGAARPVSAS